MTLLIVSTVAGSVCAVEIQGLSVYDYSSYYHGSRYDFSAEYVINEYGYDPETGYHTDERYEYAYWMNGIGTDVDDGDQYITIKFDPIAYTLQEIRIWNFNRNGYTSRGVGDVEILVAQNGTGPYTSLGTFPLSRAPGEPDYAGESISVSYGSPVRYVKFRLVSTQGDSKYAGFSELKFYGTATNEPPYVFAGKPKQVQALSTVLDGAVTDDGGTPTIQWSKVAGPNTIAFTDDTDPCTVATTTDAGFFELYLEADDGAYDANDITTVRFIPAWWHDVGTVTIDSVSGNYGDNYHDAENMINGNGLADNGYHTAASRDFHWCSDSAASTSWVIFDLGTTVAIDGVRIWNFNYSYPAYLEDNGVSSLDISVSNDKSTWENLGTFSLNEPPDMPWDTSQIFALSPSQSYRYIRFDNFSNYGGDEVGLSEVRFSGVKDNLPPSVDAGPDLDTWLDPNEAVVTIDATGSDDGQPDPPGALSYEWTYISGPTDYSFDDAFVEDPTVTFTATGAYEFQVEANDGSLSDTDNVVVTVYEDGCAHAQAQPGYVPLDGDLNGDCKVTLTDLALFTDTWLMCDSSDPDDCP